MRDQIFRLVSSIAPYDALELSHKEDVVTWLTSDAEIFRLQKPDIPPKHLVCYFTLFDAQKQKLLLIKHKKAGLWLPPGGHVEKNEHPRNTVIREAKEELSLAAEFLYSEPLFITVTRTVNEGAGHIDVTLWYVLKGNSESSLLYDPNEIDAYQWFSLVDLAKQTLAACDPHFYRFVNKLGRIIRE